MQIYLIEYPLTTDYRQYHYAVCTQGGVVVLLVAVCTNVAYNTASKSLSVDIGGAKRLHALSSAMSTCLLLPWTAFIFLTRQVSIVCTLDCRCWVYR